MASVRLYGDRDEAARWIGRAYQLLNQLKFDMSLAGFKQGSKVIDLDERTSLRLDIGFLNESIEIESQEVEAGAEVETQLYVVNWNPIILPGPSRRVYGFTEEGLVSAVDSGVTFVGERLGVPTNGIPMGCSFFNGFLYVSDWWNGGFWCLDQNLNILYFETLAYKVQPIGPGTACQKLVIREGKMVVGGNFTTEPDHPYAFDTNFPSNAYLYEISAPVFATSCNFDINNGIIYVLWCADYGGGNSLISTYNLSDGSYIDDLANSDWLGVRSGDIKYYNGQLYVTDTVGKRILVLALSGALITEHDCSSEMFPVGMTDQAEPRGISVDETGVYVSGFYYRGACASYPTYCPTDNVAIYKYTSSLAFTGNAGHYGYDPDGGLHRPFYLEAVQGVS